MNYYNYSNQSSNSQDMVPYSSQDRSERRTYGTVTRSKPKQLASPIPSSVPSVDELDRMERWMAIQERMAKLNSMPRQGHTYGKVIVSGNARAIRGNLYDDSASPSSFRQHTYGEGIVRDGGMIWDGDISVSALNRQR